MKALMVLRARIEYPIEARRAGISGSGMFEMRINPKTGRVKGVLVVQSTGSQILDWAAARGFSHFRFKSGAIVTAQAPVKFSLSRSW
jgi:TonB family protein